MGMYTDQRPHERSGRRNKLEARPRPQAHAGRLRSKRSRQSTVHETSAGGLCVKVEGGQPYVAVIIRRNRSGRMEWCLPKGHLEPGESQAEAAAREIEEETGVSGEVICHLSSVEYWFRGYNARIHKVVHHYLMEYTGGEITAENDPDQEAEDAQWIPLKEAPVTLSYVNERRVAQAALSLLYPANNRLDDD